MASEKKLQNRAARIITRSGYEIRSTDLLHKLGWQSLEERWQVRKAMMMYNITNNLAPPYLIHNFDKRENK